MAGSEARVEDAIRRPAEPNRVIANLRELAALTGGPDGARRVCWSPEWQKAREWFRGKLSELPCTVQSDEAGNVWAEIKGQTSPVVVVGSHIDSVPHGGWLDGALGVVTALEILRQWSGSAPPVTLRLVDWADEEGARFGRSLLGSSAAAGTLDIEKVRGLRDRDGTALPDALAACGVELDRMPEAGNRLKDIDAYLELHIEQGPVLEQMGLSLGAVLGTFGVERHSVRFEGRASHAGSTPMALRHDALLSAARFALEARDGAIKHGGVATSGVVSVEPGIVTAIAGVCNVSLDQRALDAGTLAAMLADAKASANRIASEDGTTVTWEQLWRIEPIPFHTTLVDFARESCCDVTGTEHSLPSGPLHDAAEMARLLPTTMMFVSSTNGISHSPLEDTPEEHLKLAVEAYSRLAAKTINWVYETHAGTSPR
ncbi:MAG: Amidase, hydantoinase/carbamoylase [Chloroflexi bacterium]|nr:Amidase, hydantoinase/carbamoylase [Chloroflexota bacterium]